MEAILLSEARTASGAKNKEESEMKSAWKRILTVSVMAVVLVASMASLALAAPDNAKGGPNPHTVLAYIAGKTNADMKTLMEEFKAGKTLQEICAAHGVDWSVIEAVFAPNKAKNEENRQKAIQRLEKHIANLLEHQGGLQDRIAKMHEAIDKLQARIPGIENETLKGFAARRLELMQHRLVLVKQTLELVGDGLALARDEMAYLKSL
jgi:hypothetical protein